jgi:hypothetical protein
VKHTFTLSFVSGHGWVKDIPTHYWWVSLGNLVAHKTLVGKRFTCAQYWVSQQSSFVGVSSNCAYAWNIRQGHNTNVALMAKAHKVCNHPPKYFKRETLLRIEWHDSQLNHFHVKWDTESHGLHQICCSAIDNRKE